MKPAFPIRAFVLLMLGPVFARPADLTPGSMQVHWDPRAKSCPVGDPHPIQVHRYDAQTYVLREKLCSTWEAPFMYLVVGSKRALLIDTGDIADPKLMPLATQVMDLLPGEPAAKWRRAH